MARSKDLLKVEVMEDATEETRMITVTIFAPAAEFVLADQLRQRGVVGGIDASLKAAARDAVQRYLEGTEELVASLSGGQKRAGNGAKQRVKTAVEMSPDEAVSGSGARAQDGLPGYAEAAAQGNEAGEVLSIERA